MIIFSGNASMYSKVTAAQTRNHALDFNTGITHVIRVAN